MENPTLAALRVELDQTVKDLEYLSTEGVSHSLSKEELAIMAARAAAIRSLIVQVEESERRQEEGGRVQSRAALTAIVQEPRKD